VVPIHRRDRFRDLGQRENLVERVPEAPDSASGSGNGPVECIRVTDQKTQVREHRPDRLQPEGERQGDGVQRIGCKGVHRTELRQMFGDHPRLLDTTPVLVLALEHRLQRRTGKTQRSAQQRQHGTHRKIPVTDDRIDPPAERLEPAGSVLEYFPYRETIAALELFAREQGMKRIVRRTRELLQLRQVEIVQPDDEDIPRPCRFGNGHVLGTSASQPRDAPDEPGSAPTRSIAWRPGGRDMSVSPQSLEDMPRACVRQAAGARQR